MKSPAALLGAALLAAALTAPTASATVLADPAPTNVKISWMDSSRESVKVTWEEDAARPNKVFVRSWYSPRQLLTRYVPTDGPNEIEVPKAEIAGLGDLLEIGVVVGTEAGETSGPALAPAFDTLVPLEPKLADLTASGASTVNLRWSVLQTGDLFPNDPLDVNESQTFQPQYSTGGLPIAIGKPSTAKQISFAGPATGYRFEVSSTNEWGTVTGSVANARSSNLAASFETWGRWGLAVKFLATHTDMEQPRTAIVQVRDSAAKPWAALVAMGTDGGTFTTNPQHYGTRQFRIAMTNQVWENTAWFGGYTPAVTVTTQNFVWYARFKTSTVNRGATAQPEIRISPSTNGKVTLQRWTGKTWAVVGNVSLKNGLGAGAIRSTVPGRVAYRFYVPATTVNGRYVAAAYSPNFVLTTR